MSAAAGAAGGGAAGGAANGGAAGGGGRGPILDLAAMADGVVRDAEGVWRTGAADPVRYPEDHDLCAALEDASYWFRHRTRVIVELLRSLGAPPGAFVDVGGGNGVISAAVAAAGRTVVLVEPGAAGIANARRRGVPNLVLGLLQDARFHEGAFAAAGLFDVVEHVPEARALLEETRRVLMPGGLCIITVPALPWLWSAEDERAGHVRRYRLRELAALAESAGLRVEMASGLFRALVWPVFLARRLPWLLGIRRAPTAERYGREHGTSRPGLLTRLITSSLDREAAALAAGRRFREGSSIILAARRPA